jgi:hypothetical protein
MQKLVRAFGVLAFLFGIVVYARDCRMSFNQWKHCGGEPGQPGLVGDWAQFRWRPAGLFSDILHVDGEPPARLVKYHFHLDGDVIEIASLDGSKTSRYCGK